MMKLIFLRLISGQEYSIGENSSNLLRSLDTPFNNKVKQFITTSIYGYALTGFESELSASNGTSIIFLLVIV